ncbi:MAG: metallophosphoesterase [Polyangiaceae bacterium]
MPNLFGPNGRLYADPHPAPGEVAFRQDNTSSAYYNSPYYLAHKNQVQRVPPRRNNLPVKLTDFLPTEVVAAIQSSGSISFHATGDTGAAKVNRSQSVTTALADQGRVAQAMVDEVDTQGDSGPAFLFLLGDVIYNFGEGQYYYDQFYEPYRAYDRPIFAIPGNHDGAVFGAGSSAPQVPSLDAFLTNFCAAAPGPAPDAFGLVRSAMTQPGVYFTLDAPFVSIIGLYSNTLEGPGVISSQNGHFPIGDDQLSFLKTELIRLKSQRESGQRAIVLAVHHPPLSADALHGGSTGVQADMDACCREAGIWPDLVLSGHAHLYQRFTRTVDGGKQTPYLVAGSGGFAVTAPTAKTPAAPVSVGDHTLEIDPILKFGYLVIETDGKTALTVTFKSADGNGVAVQDKVSVDLATGKVAGATPAGSSAGARGRRGSTSSRSATKKAPAKKTTAKKSPRKSATRRGG